MPAAPLSNQTDSCSCICQKSNYVVISTEYFYGSDIIKETCLPFHKNFNNVLFVGRSKLLTVACMLKNKSALTNEMVYIDLIIKKGYGFLCSHERLWILLTFDYWHA